MDYRTLGDSGIDVSLLGFGCGNIGGLLVRGDYPTMRQTVARAIELGVTYFDTASMYGNGQSEVNLGAILRELQTSVRVGTKVRFLHAAELERIEETVVQSVENSLRRLGRESIDLIQLHNQVGMERDPASLYVSAADLNAVVTAFQRLQQQGKICYWGITGLGETKTLHQIVNSGGLHSIQCCYNLLNPSAGRPVAADFPFQNYRQLIDMASVRKMGVIAIRVLAGGALSGLMERHPVAAREVIPISSSETYANDVTGAQRFTWLINEGHVTNLVEAAVRFVISNPAISTALVGISNLEQLEQAVGYVNRGPLPATVLDRLYSSTIL